MMFLGIYILGCFISHVWINRLEKNKKMDKVKNLLNDGELSEDDQKSIYNGIKYFIISLSWLGIIGGLIELSIKNKIN